MKEIEFLLKVYITLAVIGVAAIVLAMFIGGVHLCLYLLGGL